MRRRRIGSTCRSTFLRRFARDPDLAGWNGLGFVIQAYGKRCPFVIDWLVDLARRTQRRMMVRLVKGAYWDSEIKRAQVDGLDGFPVFTRKVAHRRQLPRLRAKTARRAGCGLSAIRDPQRADAGVDRRDGRARISIAANTSFSACMAWASRSTRRSSGADKLDRPCRIYAPVGTHETLLAYLVRRLLENGANTSFVNRIADENVSIDELIADPVAVVRAIQPLGAPHDKIAASARSLWRDADQLARARPLGRATAGDTRAKSRCRPQPNRVAPFRRAPRPRRKASRFAIRRTMRDVVGHVRYARPDEVAAAIAAAAEAAPGWAATPPNARAAILRRAADAYEAANDELVGLIVREAGKSYANAVAEVREAVDFLRYYASEAARTLLPGSPRAARRRRLHQPVELPARDLHRPDRRRARRRQRRRRQAGGGDAADRGRRRAAAA